MSDKNQQAQQEPTQDLGALMKVRREKKAEAERKRRTPVDILGV